jgi:hypothetical protein
MTKSEQPKKDDLLIGNTDKRIDDLKWALGIILGVISVLIGTLSINSSVEKSAEKNSLIEFKKELREEVGKGIATPKLVLKTFDNKSIEGSTLTAWVAPGSKNKNLPQIKFQFVIANQGKGRSGPMFAKFYSSDIRFEDTDVEQTGYKYATFVNSDDFNHPSELLGNVVMPYTISLNVPADFRGFEGSKEMLIKLYYGIGEVYQAKVKLQMKT